MTDNFEKISEGYNEYVTRRIEHLKAVVEVIASNEARLYREDTDTDAFVAISTLNIVVNELDGIVNALAFMDGVLKTVDASEGKKGSSEVKAGD